MTTRHSLRRSCRNCASSKRKCDCTWPKCSRCVTRRLECLYDNEPLTGTAPKLQSKVKSHSSEEYNRSCLDRRSSTDTAGEEKIPTTSSVANQPVSLWVLLGPSSPEVKLALDKVTSDYLLQQQKSFVSMFTQSGTTPFIHPQLYQARIPEQVQDAFALCGACERLGNDSAQLIPFPDFYITMSCRILEQSKRATSLFEYLASAHALMLTLINFLGRDDAWRPLKDALSRRLQHCTGRIWEMAPTHLPSSLSPWQAWIFAESIRRTILVAYMVQGHYAQFKQGFYIHTLCHESLPFDVRSSLWAAPQSYAWYLSAGGNTTAMLASYHEFTDLWERGEVDSIGPFEKLLLIACKGKAYFESHESSRPTFLDSSLGESQAGS